MERPLPTIIAGKAKLLSAVGIDEATNEVELILCHVLECTRTQLYLNGSAALNDRHWSECDRIIERRRTRHPLQYILGEAWFYGARFRVTPAVMVPTPETEILCELALGFVAERQLSRPRILDVGTGSGVIAVTMARELDSCEVVAVDISTDALEVARGNAVDLGVDELITFHESDLLSSIKEDVVFDLILSNPPYIAEPDYADLPPEVKADPKLALTSGPEGLDSIKKLLAAAPDHLSPRGRLMFEVGFDQAERVADLTSEDDRYQSIVIRKDLGYIDRVVILGCD
jgi:release factor glutamine methyltransferase